MATNSNNFKDFDTAVKALIDKIKAGAGKRFILGIAGYPGSGKSTMSEHLNQRLIEELGPDFSIVIGMDGYHLSNEKLESMGILHLKGIPGSFDSPGFIKLIKSIKNNQDKDIFAPRFDRSIEASIENAIKVSTNHKVVIVEGNYLLLDSAPWNELKEIMDEIWFLEVAEQILWERLVERHIEGGKSKEGAEEKVLSTDFPNAALVRNSKQNADKIFDFEGALNPA